MVFHILPMLAIATDQAGIQKKKYAALHSLAGPRSQD